MLKIKHQPKERMGELCPSGILTALQLNVKRVIVQQSFQQVSYLFSVTTYFICINRNNLDF